MLESFADQGESLRHSAPPASLRLVTLVSQGDSATELPLLWQLCLALHGFGYPPVVLDATSLESQQHPGLQDLLGHAHWTQPDTSDALGWQVMPAASGLRTLARARTADQMPLQPLAPLFRDYSVIVLYARAELLIPLLRDSGAQPVLAVTPSRSGVLQGYRTLKQLALQARLVPTLVAPVASALKNAESLAKSAAKKLQNCAMTYLGCNADMMTVRSDGPPGHRTDDAQRLALRLLESAIGIGAEQQPGPWMQRAAAPLRMAQAL